MKAKLYDVIIVGAGAAGIGCALVLRDLGIDNYTILERGKIGESFLMWSRETRFISPSFTGNAFGQIDLNAVSLYTSPAFTLGTEHPTGAEYSAYLQAIAEHYELPVKTNLDVLRMSKVDELFHLETARHTYRSRFVIWAAGEFQYPRVSPFPGAEYCVAYNEVGSWRVQGRKYGDEALVIGGYESGIDAAVNLGKPGRVVRVLDTQDRWGITHVDPSVSLSPYTRQRLIAAERKGRLEMISQAVVNRVERRDEGYAVYADDGRCWNTSGAPILATGFAGGVTLIADLFEWNENGSVQLTPHDESTITPDLFVSGPQVRHDNTIFCFIYKFRQRFAVIAAQIGQRLGCDLSPLDEYRERGMYLEDLSCCGESCAC
jgi:thioredoxin reductase